MNITPNITLNNIQKRPTDLVRGGKHLNDFPIFCDEKRHVRIKRYIQNVSATYRILGVRKWDKDIHSYGSGRTLSYSNA